MQNAIELLKAERAGLDAAIAILEGKTPGATTATTTTKKAAATTAKTEEKAKELTIEDVIAACQAHTAKNNGDRTATIAIIEKYGVKNVQKLEKEKFAAIIKDLKA